MVTITPVPRVRLAGKVKCICIDPPYNTGVDERSGDGKRTGWIYNDDVNSPEIHPDLTNDRLDRAVQVNGPSMLFGVAREILRAATGRGPHAPLIIPSTHFLQRMPRPSPPAPDLPELPHIQK